jgi:hypothetical protein
VAEEQESVFFQADQIYQVEQKLEHLDRVTLEELDFLMAQTQQHLEEVEAEAQVQLELLLQTHRLEMVEMERMYIQHGQQLHLLDQVDTLLAAVVVEQMLIKLHQEVQVWAEQQLVH